MARHRARPPETGPDTGLGEPNARSVSSTGARDRRSCVCSPSPEGAPAGPTPHRSRRCSAMTVPSGWSPPTAKPPGSTTSVPVATGELHRGEDRIRCNTREHDAAEAVPCCAPTSRRARRCSSAAASPSTPDRPMTPSPQKHPGTRPLRSPPGRSHEAQHRHHQLLLARRAGAHSRHIWRSWPAPSTTPVWTPCGSPTTSCRWTPTPASTTRCSRPTPPSASSPPRPRPCSWAPWSPGRPSARPHCWSRS